MKPLNTVRAGKFHLRAMKEYRAGNWEAAEQLFTQAIEAKPDFAAAHFKIGMCHFRRENWHEAHAAMVTAIDLDPSQSQWTVQRDQALQYLQASPPTSLQEEEQLLQLACAAEDADAATFARLADNLRKQGRRWQEIGALEQAVARDPENAGLQFKLGDALDQMRRYRQAAQAFEVASQLVPGNANYAFRAGFAHEREGFDGPADPAKAAAAYAQAIDAEKSGAAARFGIGYFHQKRGHWREAAAAYEEHLPRDPFDAELLYRLGLSHDRQFNWEKAETYIARSVGCDPFHPNRHARLGFVRERQGKFAEAAAAYEFAADLGGKSAADRRYRQGYTLASAGEFEQATAAFLQLQEDYPETLSSPYADDLSRQAIADAEKQLETDQVSPALHFAMASAHEVLGNWSDAADAYRKAIARSDSHRSNWYFSLGVMLTRAGRFEEACEAFIETRCLTAADGWISRANLKPYASLRRARYAEYYERLPIRDNTVLYECFHGRSMTCSPLAIFRELLSREDFADWTHIWVMNDRTKIPAEFRALPNVIYLSRGSDSYMRALASTKVLVNNATFPVEFTRKEGQTYLNTWHGTPIKTLGKFIRGSVAEHANTARNFLHTTHLLSPNPHTSEVLVDHYDIGGLYRGEIAETGYPRMDATLALPEEQREKLRAALGAKPGQKILLYAPTFRGNFGGAELDNAGLVADLRAMQSEGYHLVFRGHYETERLIRGIALDCTVVPEEIDSNSLLSVVDVLVSDYSSITIDFLPRRKPIIYYAYDLEEYETERGMYFPLSDLPGEIVQDRENLQAAIKHADERFDEGEHDAAIARFSPMDDGRVSARVVDWVFNGKAENVKVLPPRKPADILFYPGSMIPNGITTSFINLTSHIDHARHKAACLIDANVAEHEDRIEQVRRLPEGLDMVMRVGAKLFKPEEMWVEAKFDAQHRMSDAMSAVLEAAYTRELRRQLGPLHVETLVNFDGYTRLFERLFAFAPNDAAERKVLYLHNDMVGEWRERFPHLEGYFRTYDRFDALVSVSETLRDHNCAQLKNSFGIAAEKFAFAENMHNPDYVRHAAEEGIESPEERALFDKAATTFVTMGRMSLEKDQAKLIRAFAKVRDAIPTARLFVLGDGPLRQELVDTIKALKLTNTVFLLGQKSNPFPYLKRADCFVLPSNHEGQPMVLMEALILDLPIIATDIPGNRGALKGKPGQIVENSEDGLAEAMIAFAKAPPAPVHFDIEAYQRGALDHFESVLQG